MLPIFVLLLGLAAVSQAQAAGRTLTVGYYDFPPVMYGDSHGVTRGEMAELTRLVLRRAGYRPRFRRFPSALLNTALRAVASTSGSAHPASRSCVRIRASPRIASAGSISICITAPTRRRRAFPRAWSARE